MQIAKHWALTGCSSPPAGRLLDEPREHAWQRAVDSLRVLSRHARHAWGITLVIEQLQPYESNLLTTCDDMVRMLDEVDSDALQCCVDVVAMAVVGDRLERSSSDGQARPAHPFRRRDPSGHYVCGDGTSRC